MPQGTIKIHSETILTDEGFRSEIDLEIHTKMSDIHLDIILDDLKQQVVKAYLYYVQKMKSGN